MYFINPFKKKGMSISDLTSTHPPTAERIHILKAMGGASFTDYERAYQQTKGKSVIPDSALTGTAGAIPLRQASDDSKPKINDQNSRLIP